MRITDHALMTGILTDLNATRQALAHTQGVLASGRDIQVPSDDPARAMDAMLGRAALDENGQYQRNVSSGLTWLQGTDSALSQAHDLVQRARQLVVQGADATISQGDALAIAQELGQIANALVSLGNNSVEGRYLFGGAKTLTPPLAATGTPPTAVTYNGDSGSLNRDLAPGVSETVNVRGDQVFTGANGILPAVITAYNDAQAGNSTALGNDLQTLDAALDNLTAMRTDVGARINRLSAANAALSSMEGVLTQQVATAEDADMARTATQYASLQVSYQAALSAAGRMLPTTLIEFLR